MGLRVTMPAPAAGSTRSGCSVRERLARRRQAVVVGDGVVGDAHVDRVLQRHAAAGQTRHVVDDHVVEDVDRVPEPGVAAVPGCRFAAACCPGWLPRPGR